MLRKSFQLIIFIVLVFSQLNGIAKQVEGFDALFKKLENQKSNDSVLAIIKNITYQITDFDDKTKELIYQKTLHICRKSKINKGEFYTNLIFSKHYLISKNWKKADKCLEKAGNKTSDSVKIYLHYQIANEFFANQIFDLAKDNYLEVIELIDIVPNQLVSYKSCKKLAFIYEKEGDYKLSNSYLKKAVAYNKYYTNGFINFLSFGESNDYSVNLKQKEQEIKKEKKINNYLLLTILFLVFFVILAITTGIKTRKQNKKLSLLNKKVLSQNKEIADQSNRLELANSELRKLSIIARETDNAITVVDNKGKIDWVNGGFTKLYGYRYKEFVSEKGDSIFKASTNPDIRKIFFHCYSEKHSELYESYFVRKTGERIWVQSTMTPIINHKGDIDKFIVIDSDITQLKQFEDEIIQQNEEILQQKQVLEKQNEEIKTQRDELKAKNDLIYQKNELIKGSIRYAQTIQQSILPTKSTIEKHFNFFVCYRPKDIVSGDFYWFLHDQSCNTSIIAVADCTGHGVPGAFMSIIGYRMLNEIIKNQKIYNPAKILTELEQKVIRALNQKETDSMEGMDISICNIQKQTNKNAITFAGAKHPVIYYDHINQQLHIVKGTKKGIGGIFTTLENRSFENNKFTLNKGDKLYLFSDGVVDQNNSQRKRFGTQRLRKFLENNAHLNISEQDKKFNQTLDEWKQDTEQRDDISFFAFQM